VENDERAYFVVMLAILAAGVIAQAINLPGIVGAFLAGLAVNAAVQRKPAKEKLEFFGNSLFIPFFFVVTVFLIDLTQFFETIVSNLALVTGTSYRVTCRYSNTSSLGHSKPSRPFSTTRVTYAASGILANVSCTVSAFQSGTFNSPYNSGSASNSTTSAYLARHIPGSQSVNVAPDCSQ